MEQIYWSSGIIFIYVQEKLIIQTRTFQESLQVKQGKEQTRKDGWRMSMRTTEEDGGGADVTFLWLTAGTGDKILDTVDDRQLLKLMSRGTD